MNGLILRIILASVLSYVANVLGGSLILMFLGFASMDEASPYDAEFARDGAAWLFLFSMMLAFFWILPTVIVTLVSIILNRKVMRSQSATRRMFVLFCTYFLLSALLYFIIPILGKTIRESTTQVCIVLGALLIVGYVCFVPLKFNKIGRVCFSIAMLVLFITLHELSAPGYTFNYQPWTVCFIGSIYIVPGWYVLNFLNSRWNLTDPGVSK